jgi:tRNA U34 5-carboxymethylaminomethyl modifying GTPase MnmE/TrmE
VRISCAARAASGFADACASQLRAKLAKLRVQLLEPDTKSRGPGEGFDVQKRGSARVALIGFPSVGKSTLLNTVTRTESATAAYEYTTLTAIPGVLEYEGAEIQLLDLPGIIEGASQGRGRGRQVVSVAKTADLILVSRRSRRERASSGPGRSAAGTNVATDRMLRMIRSCWMRQSQSNNDRCWRRSWTMWAFG